MNDHERREVERDVYVSLREHFEALRGEDRRWINDRFSSLSEALKLQAEEYKRRLNELNGEYKRDQQRQSLYVTEEKWETVNKAEQEAREAALLRINEKFDDYILRYEARQREVDVILEAQKSSAAEAKRIVEKGLRDAEATAQDQARRMNRNLGIAGLLLTTVLFAVNIIPRFLS